MISSVSLITILGMAAATYLTRVTGVLLLRNRKLSPRNQAVMEAAPGCVLIAVIAPAFTSPNPAEILALAVAILAAWRLPMLAAVVVSVATLAVLTQLM